MTAFDIKKKMFSPVCPFVFCCSEELSQIITSGLNGTHKDTMCVFLDLLWSPEIDSLKLRRSVKPRLRTTVRARFEHNPGGGFLQVRGEANKLGVQAKILVQQRWKKNVLGLRSRQKYKNISWISPTHRLCKWWRSGPAPSDDNWYQLGPCSTTPICKAPERHTWKRTGPVHKLWLNSWSRRRHTGFNIEPFKRRYI